MLRIPSRPVPVVDERTSPDATIAIVTKGRRGKAFRATASAVAQSTPVEVLVDHGSSDGTAVAIRTVHPVRPWFPGSSDAAPVPENVAG